MKNEIKKTSILKYLGIVGGFTLRLQILYFPLFLISLRNCDIYIFLKRFKLTSRGSLFSIIVNVRLLLLLLN